MYFLLNDSFVEYVYCEYSSDIQIHHEHTIHCTTQWLLWHITLQQKNPLRIRKKNCRKITDPVQHAIFLKPCNFNRKLTSFTPFYVFITVNLCLRRKTNFIDKLQSLFTKTLQPIYRLITTSTQSSGNRYVCITLQFAFT